MNWGNKIVIAFILFASFIGYMVVRAFQEDFDLVAEDYYAQEINYQEKLNKLSNTALANKNVSVSQTASLLRFQFPDKADGEIQFYHPSRKMFDRTFEIQLTGDGIQTIEKKELVPGNYRINISWNTSGEEYLQQQTIYIQ